MEYETNNNKHLTLDQLADFIHQDQSKNDLSGEYLHLQSCQICQKHLQEQKEILVFTDESFQRVLLDEVSLKRVELSLSQQIYETRKPKRFYRENIFNTLFTSYTFVLAGFAVLLIFGFWGVRSWNKVSHSNSNSALQASNNFGSKNLVVTQNEKLDFSLESHAHLHLEPYSQLSIVESSPNTTVISLSKGHVQFEVPKLLHGQKFIVQTPQFQVHVIGTVFQVSWNDQNGSVSVSEGVVAVYTQDGSSYSLKHGEQYVYQVQQKVMHQIIRPNPNEENKPSLPSHSQMKPDLVRKDLRKINNTTLKEKSMASDIPPDISISQNNQFDLRYQTIKDRANLGMLSEQELSAWLNDRENQEQPQFLSSLLELGKFLQERFLKQQAITVFEKAMSLQLSEEVIIELIRGNFAAQRYDNVLHWTAEFKKTFSTSSSFQEVGYIACQSAVLIQDFQKAVHLCKEHVVRYPSSVTAKDTHYLLATIYREKFQDCVNAVTEYTHSLVYTSLGSTYPEALYWRGFCYHEMGEIDRAFNDFHQLLQSYSDFPRIQEVSQMINTMKKSSVKTGDARLKHEAVNEK